MKTMMIIGVLAAWCCASAVMAQYSYHPGPIQRAPVYGRQYVPTSKISRAPQSRRPLTRSPIRGRSLTHPARPPVTYYENQIFSKNFDTAYYNRGYNFPGPDGGGWSGTDPYGYMDSNWYRGAPWSTDPYYRRGR